MKRRNFLTLLASSSAASMLSGLTFGGSHPSVKSNGEFSGQPNILFLFSDDQRFDTIHALGNDEIITPNMDRLVKHGVTFTHAHIMGSMLGAVCVPSRAMLMAGRTLFHLKDGGKTIPPEHVTLPEILKKADYRTFGTGKWHNGASAYARSFTHGRSIFFGGMSNHTEVPVHDFDATGEYPREKRTIGKKFSSNLFSDAAIRFLQHYEDDKPFFMYVSYTAPHDPRMAPAPYSDMYSPEQISLPKNFLPEHPFDNGEMKIRDEMLAPFPRTIQTVREHIAAYYAMITHLDAQIGRVLKALEDTQQAKNTIIVFAGDNGLAVGQHGLLGKQNLYEHSVRVPLILSGPGLPQGEKRDAQCYLLDVFPTICDLIDMPIPSSVEGRSLLPVLRDPDAKVRDSLFLAYKHIQRGLHTDPWKLILYNLEGKRITQLFDLLSDPWELNNLANDPDYGSRVEELVSLLRYWMKRSGDECDLDKPGWGC